MNSFLIIYCHPYQKSLNHAVLQAVENNLSQKQIQYTIIDLYQEKFQPIYDLEELRLFHTGETHDPLVEKYLNLLKKAQGVIIITPIWWNSIPGMLKGFIDKVMKEGEGLSHTVSKMGIHGCLTNLTHAYVLTTSTSPTIYFKLFMGNSIKKIFISKTLRQLGVKQGTWINFGNVTHSTLAKRQQYLQRINNYQFKF
ncbi:NAD(P)H-dependent oxidoreductase [Lactiplantibacillus plantarum]|uniref:NAD(P)H-dependent oxidoreductase n=1 Tax=Lactiplantibacillus plantarum TaxID=1590 RepID=UPI000977B28A|nr:NAD(P)H-dependent oxidoreductase [Lactiplantibacillus plantarum]TLQ24585.1 NAD(P)H-dependent oxidoreductase [Lactiplantibacillus plantarum]TXJ65588.1 NAD(P)H-dependent oxidoreductase [Lactiplantibacillus plantarum]TXJ69543.1 NAD(P)H-dependent oxidoreductase [Lactiplantibacillus plantarum]TXJ91308.1 NAD(P)H-dependent oxidoreductase [Lactiplantibacillus plantarum]